MKTWEQRAVDVADSMPREVAAAVGRLVMAAPAQTRGNLVAGLLGGAVAESEERVVNALRAAGMETAAAFVERSLLETLR